MGRIFAGIGAALLIAGCGGETVSDNVDAAATSQPTVFVNYADDFVAFWDSTTELSTEQRVDVFNSSVAELFPEFYGIDRYEGSITQDELDARIAAQIERFGSIREKFIEKSDRFSADLEHNLATFKETFPDYELPVEVVLLHSMGQFNGATRTLAGKDYLLFGPDIMALVHSWDDDAAFFHHELFHTLHDQAFAECDEMWCALWTEGLAVHVSSALNPDAGEPALLLDFPPGLAEDTRAQLRPALEHLQSVLTSTDEDVYSALYNTRSDDTGLPPRRGYVLGYLVAQEIAQSHSLTELAILSNEDVEPLIPAAIERLLAREAE